MKIRRWIGTGILITLLGTGITVIASTQLDFNEEIKKTFMDPTLEEKSLELEEVKKIYFSGSAETLKICYTEDQNLFHYYEGKHMTYDIDYNKEEQTLRVVQNYKVHFGFSLIDTSVLYIHNALDELVLDVNAANVCLDKINISNLDIKVSAGNLELNQVTASTSTLEANAGNIKMKDTIFDTVAMKLNAGNLTFQGDILQTGRIQADLGNMTLHLNREEEAYTINGLGNGKTSITYDVSLGNQTILYKK